MNIQTVKVGIISTNCYILTDEKTNEAIVIDPGSKCGQIIDAVKDKNVKYILLTHGHYDHILGAAQLKRLTGAALAIGAEDEECLRDDILSRAGLHFKEPQENTCADIILHDGDTLPFGGQTIKVIHTPGHTPGGVCYLFDEENALFSGDTLFNLAIGRTDFQGGSDVDMARSLKKIAALSRNYDVFPGHGPSSTLDYEKKHNPYFVY